MRIKNHEYYADLVQRAVDVAIGIRVQMDEIAESAESGNFSIEEGKKLIYRRLRALERIRQIQAAAYKRAYGVEVPTIPGIG